jgi:histidinol-phosphate aminotransferase
MPKPRESVVQMAPYSPPAEGRNDALRLDFNENTVGCSPAVVEFLKTHLTADVLSMYPEYTQAKPELASFFGVAESEMLFTNGTDEAIQVVINTYVDDADDVLLLRPSYAMYRFYAELAGASIREIEFQSDLSFPLDSLLAAIRPSTRAILIANPNNPTGTGIDVAGIERILEAAPDAAVLIDEAYFDFSGVTVLPLLSRYASLFVSRTFSKVYGMAAMRFGCLFSQSANVRILHKAQSPYSVNTLAALAARAAIRDAAYVRDYVCEVLAARELIYNGLRDLHIRAYPSQANFILFEAGDRAIAIRDELRRRRVLVRDRSYEIPGAVRVTIGTRAQAEKFLEELRSIWNNHA